MSDLLWIIAIVTYFLYCVINRILLYRERKLGVAILTDEQEEKDNE
jgi:hypothetical protein